MIRSERGAVWWGGAVASVALVAVLWWSWESPWMRSIKRSAVNAWYRPQAQPARSAPAKPVPQAAPKPKAAGSPAQPPSVTVPPTASVTPPRPRRLATRQSPAKAPDQVPPATMMVHTPATAALQEFPVQTTPKAIVILRAGPASSISPAREVRASTPASGQAMTPAPGPTAGVSPPGPTLHFRSVPDATQVVINGKTIGKTPMAVHLPHGPHTILIEKTEQPNLQYKLKIDRGEDTTRSDDQGP